MEPDCDRTTIFNEDGVFQITEKDPDAHRWSIRQCGALVGFVYEVMVYEKPNPYADKVSYFKKWAVLPDGGKLIIQDEFGCPKRVLAIHDFFTLYADGYPIWSNEEGVIVE